MSSISLRQTVQERSETLHPELTKTTAPVERGDRGRNGTGLGLAICRGMIGAHGGEVEALPGPDGRGTVMRITLPLIQPPGRGDD